MQARFRAKLTLSVSRASYIVSVSMLDCHCEHLKDSVCVFKASVPEWDRFVWEAPYVSVIVCECLVWRWVIKLKEYSQGLEPQKSIVKAKREWNIRGPWVTPGWLCSFFLCIRWLVSYLPDWYDDSCFFFCWPEGREIIQFKTQRYSRSLQQHSFPSIILCSSSLSADNRECLVHLMRRAGEDCVLNFEFWIFWLD